MLANGKVIMSLVMLAIFVGMVGMATAYPAKASLLPFVIGIPGVVLCLIQVVIEVTQARTSGHDGPIVPADTLADPVIKQEVALIFYATGLILGILFLGFWLAIPIFLVAFLRYRERESWTFTLAMTASGWVVLFVLFDTILGILVHQGFLTEALIG